MTDDIIWQDHCGVLIPKVVTVEDVLISAAKQLPQHSSESNEWRTPLAYVDAVNRVIGPIDLDPASSIEANRFIMAKRFFTKENNGLDHKWFGRVFLNPPYGKWTSVFVNRLIDEHVNGDVKEAILLINSNTSTKYWQSAFIYCDAICFPRKRIAFIDEQGVPRKSPPHSNTVFYFGNRGDKFCGVFDEFGINFVK